MSQTSSPKVSVIMSAFNAEKYITASIESILSQTFADFEFIVFDDGSTDRTAEIIKKYEEKDPRIKAFYKEKNTGFAGMIENLNRGLDMAKGEYIARMDADDISYRSRFEKQVEFLDSNPEIFLVGTGAVNVNEKGEKMSVFAPLTSTSELKDRMEKVPSIYNPTVMFRRTNIRYIDLKTAEDYEIFLQMLKADLKLSNLAEKLIDYRIIPPSLSHRDPFQRAVNTVIAQEIYFERLNRNSITQEIIDRYHPTRCSKEILARMVETAYLSRSYDILFDVASIYTDRFGIDFKMMGWEMISGFKLLIRTILNAVLRH